MNCDELRDLFELYALGVLEPDEAREIERHLARDCAACGRHLKEALGLNALLLSNAPSVAPPSRLRRRVLATVGVERSSWTWLPALAAACLLVVAVWISVEERRRTGELAAARQDILAVSADRDRLQQALSFLNQPETRQVRFGEGQPAPPRGNVLVNPRLGVLFVASNLPRLTPGQTYEMWVIPKGGSPRPAGLFQSTTGNTALHLLTGPVDLASLGAVAITVEPSTGSPAPTTQPIIIAPVAGV